MYPFHFKNKLKMNFVSIGANSWSDCNLVATEFNDGRTLPVVESIEEWKALSAQGKPCCCAYDFDSKNIKKYGLIYNPHAVEFALEILPDGTRIASRADWNNLIESLGGNSPVDNYTPTESLLAIKSEKGWRKQLVQGTSVNMNGNNSSGFSALPGGDLFIGSSFRGKGFGTMWWTSDWHQPHITQYDKHVICFSEGDSIPSDDRGHCSGAYIRIIKT